MSDKTLRGVCCTKILEDEILVRSSYRGEGLLNAIANAAEHFLAVEVDDDTLDRGLLWGQYIWQRTTWGGTCICSRHKDIETKDYDPIIESRFRTSPHASPFLRAGVEREVGHAPEDEPMRGYQSVSSGGPCWGKDPYPNHPSKRELIKLSMSEKNGITSAMTNARIHVAATMPLHVDHATRVFECRCFDVRKRRKKMKREVTD